MKNIKTCSICGTKISRERIAELKNCLYSCCLITCNCSDTETICYKHLEEEYKKYGKQKLFGISCDQELVIDIDESLDNELSTSNKKITIGDLTKLYNEEFYSIELRDNLTGKILKPLKYDHETDLLTIEGFRFYIDDKNVSTLMIAVDKKQHQELFNQIKEIDSKNGDK